MNESTHSYEHSIKRDLKNVGLEIEIDGIGSEYGAVLGSFEHSNGLEVP